MSDSVKIKTLILTVIGVGAIIPTFLVVSYVVGSFSDQLYPLAYATAPQFMGWYDNAVLALNGTVTLLVVALFVTAIASWNGWERESNEF